jgi:hypothetical protein
VARQVRVRPYTTSGSLADAIIVDYVVRNPVTGELSYWDAKTSRRASKYGQSTKYELLQRYGGQVRSARSLPEWLRTAQDIGPGRVTKIHEVVDEIRHIKEGIRGTVDRGTPASSRGTGAPESRTQSVRSVEPAAPETPPVRAAGPAPGSAGTLPADINVRVKLSNTAGFRFVRGLLLNVLVMIALNLFVAYFERRVNKETEARIKSGWKDKVAPKIEYAVNTQIQMSAEGLQPKKSSVYIGVRWTLIMRELDDDLSDAIVWAVKFGSGNPGFGEIYEGLEVQKEDELLRLETRRRMRAEPFKRERDRIRGDLLRYPVLQWILVHDPDVLTAYEGLKQDLRRKEVALQGIERAYLALDPANRFGDGIGRIDHALKAYAFLSAARETGALTGTIVREFGLRATALAAVLTAFGADCQKTARKVVMSGLRFDSDQRGLLDVLAGARIPFGL